MIPTMGGDFVRCLSGFPVADRDGRCAVACCGPCLAVEPEDAQSFRERTGADEPYDDGPCPETPGEVER